MTQEILTKEYKLADVLGVITGYVLKDEGFSGIHDLIEWLAGGGVFVHQIPRIAPFCRDALKKQFPQLDAEQNASLNTDIEWLVGVICDPKYRAWDKDRQSEKVAHIWRKLKAEYGDSFQVVPMQPFDFEMPGPLDGLDKSKMVIINVPASDEFPHNIDAA